MKLFNLMLVGLLAACSIGCNKDEANPAPKVVTIDEFVGSWKASSFVFTNNADTNETFDFIANGGELRYTMLSGGGTRTWMELGTFSDEWDALVKMQGDDMIISTPEESSRAVNIFKFELEGTTLTLINHNATFDFTLTGAPVVSATSVAVFQKQ